MVHDNIKAKYLKAHIIGKILWMTPLLRSAKCWIPSDYSFNDDVINSLFDLLTVLTESFKRFVN